MKIKFFVKKSKKQPAIIFLRIWDSKRFDLTYNTGYVINFDQWNANRQEVKNIVTSESKDIINTNLRGLRNFLIDKFNEDSNTNTIFNAEWIKEKHNQYFNKNPKKANVYFLDWLDNFIAECLNKLFSGKKITASRLQRFTVVRNKIKSYEIYTKKRLELKNIDLKFHQNFVFYCQNVEFLNNNSTLTYIKSFKYFCRLMEEENLPINPQYKHRDFMIVSNKIYDVYLNENEVKLLFEYDFSNHPTYDTVRDIFIIGLNTGLRISDLKQLRKEHITGDIIEIETIKTNKLVLIYINSQIRHVLAKRNGELPTFISEQKLNLYIKEICKLVGIVEPTEGTKVVSIMNTEDKPENIRNYNRKKFGIYPKYELVKTHTCRRSFATNWHGKIPTTSIMAVTGHTTESQFLAYLKKTPTEHADIMRQYE